MTTAREERYDAAFREHVALLEARIRVLAERVEQLEAARHLETRHIAWSAIRFLTLTTAAELLAVSPVDVRIWCDEGKIPVLRLPTAGRKSSGYRIPAWWLTSQAVVPAADLAEFKARWAAIRSDVDAARAESYGDDDGEGEQAPPESA